MEIAKSSQMNVINTVYRMQTQSLLNVLEGITEDDAQKRIDNKTNSLVWMLGNFSNIRYTIGSVFGLKDVDPYQDLFFMGKAFDATKEYPTLQQLLNSFHDISPKVHQALLTVTDEILAQDFPINKGISFMKEDKLNFVIMSLGRADYIRGQMGLLRRVWDYPSVKYEVDETIGY